MGKTTVAKNLQRERIWINSDGQVISKGDPRPSGDTPTPETSNETERLDKLETGLEEIKDLLKKVLKQ
jgi:hypothetical protein